LRKAGDPASTNTIHILMETEAKLMPNGDHQRLQRSIITIPVKTFERVKNSYMFAAAWRPGVTLVDVDRLSRVSPRPPNARAGEVREVDSV
jgi:hypothetical protein